MNPRYPTPLDPVTKQPRRIPWSRWFLYACGVLLVMSALTYLWMRSYVTISVAPDTTVLTAPLLADGYPDYVGYLDAQNAAGVKPEENAWIAILRCCGPEEIDKALRAEHYRKLGIEPLPDAGPYFQHFYDTPEKKVFPEPVLIAASAAAQLPWYTRFVRLAAMNAQREANGAEFINPLMEPEPPAPLIESLGEYAGQALLIGANAAWDFAEAPEWASTHYAFEANAAANSYYLNEDDEQIQDLRPEALALIKPAFMTPEEEASWRQELFDKARTDIWSREEMIMSDHPWTRAECPMGAAWVETFSPQLDQLQKELQQRKKYYVPRLQKPGDPSVIFVLLPEIQMLRQLALSYAYRANLYLGEKNIPAALDDLMTILQLGALLPQHPMLLEELVGVAIEGIGYPKLVPLVQSSQLTDEQLAELDACLAKIVHQFDLAECLDHGERLPAIGQVVAMVAREDQAKLQHSFNPDKEIDHHWERKLVHWDSVLREMNSHYDLYRDAAKTKQLSVIQHASQAQPANTKELNELYKNPPWYLLPSKKTEVMKHTFTWIFSPALSAGYSASLKGTVRRELIRVMIALERFRRANNAYPAALAELVPKYLPVVPTDPFDGKPMKYLRTPSGGYRAYSVWHNGTDDGGMPNIDENGDADNYFNNDLVIGSPDEYPRRQNLTW